MPFAGNRKGAKDVHPLMERMSATAINSLVSQFSYKSLPKEEWTHEAQLIVSLWHNSNDDFDTALEMVKSKIKAYNESVGIPNTKTSAYHETRTIFWMIVTKVFLQKHRLLPTEEIYHRFLQSPLASRDYPLEYYSQDVFYSEKARKRWINGDRKRIVLFSEEHPLNNHFDFSDELFEQAFERCSLPADLFTHEAHLRLAWIHLTREGLDEATKTVCQQIINFVTHLGAKSKYNQTLTVAAVRIVHHFLQQSDADNFFDFILQSPQLKTQFGALLKKHYSFDVFNSETAKRQYLPPDLLPFE